MYAGIEGGATRSTLVIVDSSGAVVAEAVTDGLNYHLLGIQKTVDAVASLIHNFWPKEYPERPLKALGLGFSGAKDGSAQNEQFVKELKLKYPELAEKIYIVSDTIGTLKATLPNGIWIALRAIEYVMNENSGWETPPHSSTTVRSLMHSYFGIKDDAEILDCLHKSFSKPKIAGFCLELAKHGSDKLCAEIFFEAGVLLGRHVNVVIRNAEKHGKQISFLRIVVTGSVFKSWPLLKQGFITGTKGAPGSVGIKSVGIYTVNGSIGKGLAHMAAEKGGYNFCYDFDGSKTSIDTFDL